MTLESRMPSQADGCNDDPVDGSAKGLRETVRLRSGSRSKTTTRRPMLLVRADPGRCKVWAEARLLGSILLVDQLLVWTISNGHSQSSRGQLSRISQPGPVQRMCAGVKGGVSVVGITLPPSPRLLHPYYLGR